ncbi:hypothetical protein [Microcoleus phage My-WqHQDG]|nr:hypothetical protein [Microcoleus phage My-WqHQDG]
MTDMRQGMILASAGLSLRRDDSIKQVELYQLACAVVEELVPRYGYCTANFWYGWDYAWCVALMEAHVPYSIVLPYRAIGTKWHPSDKDKLNTLIASAHDVIYISDNYRDKVYDYRDDYLAEHAEGVVNLVRPPFTYTRVCTKAICMGKPIFRLWDRFLALYHPTSKGSPYH